MLDHHRPMTFQCRGSQGDRRIVAETASEWRPVASITELPPGGRRVVTYNGRRVLLLNVSGELFAYESLCPHQYYPLDDCAIFDGLIECPFHLFRYRLASGENEYPASVYPEHLAYLKAQLLPLTRFRVRVEQEVIFLASAVGAP